MAALEKIRSKGKIVMAIVFVALLCFVIGDFLSNSSAFFNRNSDKVGEVFGKKLSYADFQREVDARTNFQKINGTFTNDEKVRQDTWEAFTKENTMNKQAEEIGLTITPEELEYNTKVAPHWTLQNCRMLQGENGQFSRQVLDRWLNTFKRLEEMTDDDKKGNPDIEQLEKFYSSWLCAEKDLQYNLLYEKMVNLLFKATSEPKAEIEFKKNYANQVSDCAIAQKPYFAISDSAYSVTPEEAKAKYDELKKEFKSKPARNVRIIVFDVNPLAEDTANARERAESIEKELMASEDNEDAILLATQECDPSIFNRNVYLTKDNVDKTIQDFAFIANKGDVMSTIQDGMFFKTAKVLEKATNRPDSVKISCIYLTNGTKKVLRQRKDSLLNEMKNGAKFGDLAEKHSLDERSKNDKGNFGWLTEGQFGRFNGFDEKAFTGKVGETFELEDKGDFIIVKIDSISATASPKVKIAEVAIKIEASTETGRKYYESASKYLSDNNTLESFIQNAESKGLSAEEYFVTNDRSEIMGVENARKIIKWAFEKGRKEGDIVSQPFESTNQCAIAAVETIIEDGFIPYSMSAVKNYVNRKVINEKKFAAINEEWANKEVSALSADTIRGITFNDRRFENERSIESALLGTIATLKADEESAVIKGENAAYKVKVLSKTSMDMPNNDMYRGQIIYQRAINSLIEKADIEDNRSIAY